MPLPLIPIRRINAIDGVPEQSSKLHAGVTEGTPEDNLFFTYRTRLYNYMYELGAIFELQYMYGLRISELLAIKPRDISPRGTIFLKCAKGSENKMIDYPSLYTFLKNCRANGKEPFGFISRHYVYRCYKRMDISFGQMYGTKNAITHQFRYMKAKDTMEMSNDLEFTAKIMGHKNSKSTKHYV